MIVTLVPGVWTQVHGAAYQRFLDKRRLTRRYSRVQLETLIDNGRLKTYDLLGDNKWIGYTVLAEHWGQVEPALFVRFLHVNDGVSGWERGFLSCLSKRAFAQGLARIEMVTSRPGWLKKLREFIPDVEKLESNTTYGWSASHG